MNRTAPPQYQSRVCGVMEADRFIREPERRKITGLSRTSWWRAEKEGSAPRAYQLSKNTKAWKLSELMEWVEKREPVKSLGMP